MYESLRCSHNLYTERQMFESYVYNVRKGIGETLESKYRNIEKENMRITNEKKVKKKQQQQQRSQKDKYNIE